MQGRDSWMASCMNVCEHEYVFVGLCDYMQLCVCVCVKLGPRLLPEVELHSLLFHYSYKATARLHRVQSCKNFSFFSSFFFLSLRSSLPLSTPPPYSSSSSLSFMVTVGTGINICENVLLSILGFQAEAELDLSDFKQL